MTDHTNHADRVDTRHVDLTATTPSDDARTVLLNKVNWGAIIAGAVIALIVQFLLSLLGVGIGASTLDPATGNNPDAGTFSIVSAVWYGLTGIIAAFVGGFIASRMSGRTLASSGALHGLTSWAVTTLFLLYLLTTAVGTLVGGALNGLGAIAGGIGNTVATAAETAAPSLAGLNDPFAGIQDQISQATGGNDPEALQNAAVAAVRAAVTGDEAQAEQARETAAQALARSQNIPVEQARTQVEGTSSSTRKRSRLPRNRPLRRPMRLRRPHPPVLLLLSSPYFWVRLRLGSEVVSASRHRLLRPAQSSVATSDICGEAPESPMFTIHPKGYGMDSKMTALLGLLAVAGF